MFSQSSQAWNLASLGTYNFFVFLQSKRPKISIPVFSKPVVFYFSLYSIRVFFSIPLFCIPTFQTNP
jgi:hypothetical protein